jgi:hypothetical protein
MRLYAFRPASNKADWNVNFQVVTDAGPAVWDTVDDIVTLAFNYEGGCGPLDYGRVTQPPAAAFTTASNDGSDQITLVDPGLIAILIPASSMNAFPPVEMIVTLDYRRTSDGRKATLWQGRLPIIEGYI